MDHEALSVIGLYMVRHLDDRDIQMLGEDLEWYIYTGRASCDFVRAIKSCNMRRLFKYLAKQESRSTMEVVNYTKRYLARYYGLKEQ